MDRVSIRSDARRLLGNVPIPPAEILALARRVAAAHLFGAEQAEKVLNELDDLYRLENEHRERLGKPPTGIYMPNRST